MALLKLTEKSIAAIQAPTAKAQAYYWDTDLHGFGVVVGRTGRRTFVVRAPVKGRKVKVKLGIAGEPRAPEGTWTVAAARDAAKVALGRLAGGANPNAEKRAAVAASGATLRQALEFHLEKMARGENKRRKACSPRSIATIRSSVNVHLVDYTDRPIVELTADTIAKVMADIERTTPRRADSNPDNPPGRAAANRILANISAIWRSWDRRYGLPVVNPTNRLQPAELKERTTRVKDAEFGDWYTRVMSLKSSIRRDLQLVAMFTGVRTDGVCHLRWEDVDFDEDLLFIARAKGDKPYSLPMVKTVREILERRRVENAASPIFAPRGGDHGWVFPSISRDQQRVIPVYEPKELQPQVGSDGNVVRREDGRAVRVSFLPGIHVCRRTFNSVAREIGIVKEDREALMNHAGKGVNAKHYVQTERFEHLRACAEKIEAALWERIRGVRPARGATRKARQVTEAQVTP